MNLMRKVAKFIPYTTQNMKNVLFILLALYSFSCSIDKPAATTHFEIPVRNHHLSYIPYDASVDHPDYIICDSTKVNSGRNRLKYTDGTAQLKEDIQSSFVYDPSYASFNGYIVIRFLVNCEGQSGRYRTQSLQLVFSPSGVPSDLLTHTIGIIKSLDNWTKSPKYDRREEYAKFINLKFENGKIQHVLL